MEYKTKKYINNADGVSQKNHDASRLAMDGWKIDSESIEAGQFKGKKACCLASICLPLGAAAGSSEGFIVVTYSKGGAGNKIEGYKTSSFEYKKCPTCAEEIKVEARKCRYCQEEFSPEEIERAIEESKKRYEEEKSRIGKTQCPQCGNWDVYKCMTNKHGMSDYCPHCKKALLDM